MENFINETKFVFEEAGVVNPGAVMVRIREKTIRDIEIRNKKVIYTDYWKQVPPSMINKIRFLYRYELMLFEYPETPFIV